MIIFSGFLINTEPVLPIEHIAGYVIFIIGLVFLCLYLFIGIRDLIIVLKNYNILRADFCRDQVCGLYRPHNNPKKRRCLNPYISERKFMKLSASGNHKGCYWSFQLREDLSDYEHESIYLEIIRTFRGEKIWWKFITILMVIILILFGLFKFPSFLSELF